MGTKRVNLGISNSKTFKVARNLIIGGTIVAIIGTATYQLGKNSANNEEQSTSIVSTTTDVTNSNDFIDDSTMDSTTKLQNDDELKSIIDQILKVEFQPTDTYFQNYDIKNSISDELNALNNTNASETNLEETSYDWYQNGIIDSDKLYEKIIANSKASGIEITTNVEEITKVITKEIQGCLDYVKQKVPNYDSKASLKNIDTLKIDDVADKDYMSNYDSKKNLIEIDLQYSQQEKNLLEYNISYALFQALVKQGDEVYWNFISQRFNEDLIMDYENRNIDNYKDEGYKVEMLAAATGKSYEEFNKYYLESDVNSIIGAFEPEMPKEYVLSILKALDIACGYGDIPAGCDEIKFKNDASAYAKVGLLDNYYIMKMKEVYKDGKPIDDAQNEIIEVTKKVLNDKYSPLSMDDQTKAELDKCSDQLNKISYGVKYSKK